MREQKRMDEDGPIFGMASEILLQYSQNNRQEGPPSTG